MKEYFEKLEKLYEKYERRIGSAAMAFGFVFDWLTLERIDLLYENFVMLSYLVIAGGGIVVINYLHEYPSEKPFLHKVEHYLPLLIQFAFGGLFSAFFIFYNKSADFSSSWPFLLVLLSLLVGNEFFKEYYKRMVFQVSIYFVAIFSFFIFFIPIILDHISQWTFLLSGGVSLLFIYLFSETLFRTVPKRYVESRINLRNSVLAIFFAINLLYFTNLIPPIPLALTDIGVYYSVQREGEDYRVVGPERVWYQSLPLVSSKSIEWREGAPLYVFSSIFAPTNLNTRVVHDWQYFDENSSEWVSATRIDYGIRGGRDGGYRGFSTKQSLFPGKWRVDVETERGQVIGRVRFDIELSASTPALEERVI
jgi:glycosyltransferase involved in cell wall biosynthesis